MQQFQLDGQVALVTGAGSGIGRSIAIALAEAGANVAITELPNRLEAGEETASEIKKLGRQSLVIPLDQTQLPQIGSAIESVAEQFGRLNIAVNNAGMNIRKRALEVSEHDWDTVLDTDLKGVFFVSQAAARQMIRQQTGGRIVNVASVMGVGGYFERVAYCAAKAGVVNITKVLAIEWAEHGINVNAVGPAFILTPLVIPQLENAAFAEELTGRTPMKRLGKPEEVASAVVYLASPAASYVTGHTLLVDGGWTAW